MLPFVLSEVEGQAGIAFA